MDTVPTAPSATPDIASTPTPPAKSSKGLIILLLLLVLILGGALVYVLFFNNGKVTSENTDDTNAQNTVETCTYNSNTYNEGDTFDDADGCNTCTCLDGESVCTKIACVEEPTLTTQHFDCDSYERVDGVITKYTGYIDTKYPDGVVVTNANPYTDDNFCNLVFTYQSGELKINYDFFGEVLKHPVGIGFINAPISLGSDYVTILDGATGTIVRKPLGLTPGNATNPSFYYQDYLMQLDDAECAPYPDDPLNVQPPCGRRGNPYINTGSKASLNIEIPADTTESERADIVNIFDAIVANTTGGRD